MLRDAVDCLLQGDLTTGKAVLRDYGNAAIGFPALAERLGKPRAQNFPDIVAVLQEVAGVCLQVIAKQ